MKKVFIRCVLISINILFLNTLAFAAPMKTLHHFIVQLETGNTYDVTIKNNLLQWKAVAGEDLNMIMKIPFKHIALSKDVDIYQWNEKRGYFVTFIVDKRNTVAVTSTKNADNKEWLVKGKVRFLN